MVAIIRPEKIADNLPHLDVEFLHPYDMGNIQSVGGRTVGLQSDMVRLFAGQLKPDADCLQPEIISGLALQTQLLNGGHLGVAGGRLEFQRRCKILEYFEHVLGRELIHPTLQILEVQFVAKLSRRTKVLRE